MEEFCDDLKEAMALILRRQKRDSVISPEGHVDESIGLIHMALCSRTTFSPAAMALSVQARKRTAV